MPLDLRNRHGEALAHSHAPGATDDAPLVVIGHGLTSQHDRPWLKAISATLSAAGIGSLRFSFAGNGASQGRFADATISKEIGDLQAVLDAVGTRRVFYAGHSMGAAVGVLCAARDPRLAGLISLAGMVHVAEFMRRLFGHLTPDRDVMLDKPHCPLTSAFLADAEAIGDVLAAAAEIAQPWLLVHGTADELVPLRDAEDARATCPRAELWTIAGADHRFTGVEDAVGARVAAWVARHA